MFPAFAKAIGALRIKERHILTIAAILQVQMLCCIAITFHVAEHHGVAGARLACAGLDWNICAGRVYKSGIDSSRGDPCWHG